ncbi:S41 family peptidase [Spirosoma sp. RP8]|uniref:S41 family peptidase n=1 Tax=Spirosoma liriopis TaxID=2937440 RepID=A0ABT0HT87_9BACT|nr:S41 family peptidase [Spirosoma liriopis]MCK8495190.1 S41 family peptidase [Spirosoma liriopis]
MTHPFAKSTLFPVFFLLLVLSSCTKEEPKATSAQAQAYIAELIGLMSKYSTNRNKIDWQVFAGKVNAKAQGAQTIADTYPAITLALTLLEDNHSSYTAATGGTVLYGSRTLNCTDFALVAVPPTPRIGYIKVGHTGGIDANGVKYGLWDIEYAQALQEAIKAADSDQLVGWIVDLRGNRGGELYGMLAGIGPILGEGISGYFKYPDDTYGSWGYQDGTSFLDNNVIVRLPTPYQLKKSNPKVAVLTNPETASSGEGIAIAFKGRANTQSFGLPTCGVSSANAPIKLSDGARLTLTIGVVADRTKTVYGHSVQAGELLSGVAAIEAAIRWLNQ